LGPEDLRQALSSLPRGKKIRGVLVGPETWDDAGVFRLSPTRALVQTVDFITPVVNDPFDYGRIAATNAVSDVYAMGGKPITALSIVCYPERGDMTVLGEILRGGADALARAGVALLGGHTVRDPEIKFGFAVTGEVHPKRILTNAGAKRGDVLILTKALGTGILATALKRRLLPDADLKRMTDQMATLNRDASVAARKAGASAVTDVTGFGLLGHALNVARASKKTIRIWSAAVPLLPRVLELARQGVAPAGLQSNLGYALRDTVFDEGVPETLRMALADPQTSGGLLVAVAPRRAAAFMAALRKARLGAAVIGEVRAKGRTPIEVAA
jgi:selenide,water dikinase